MTGQSSDLRSSGRSGPVRGGVHLSPVAARGRQLVVAVALLIATLVACSTGKNAVATGSESTFVAPGGQSHIFYDPPATRGTVRGLSGNSVLGPGHQIDIDDFPGQVVAEPPDPPPPGPASGAAP